MKRSLAIAIVLAALGLTAPAAQAASAPIVVGTWPTGVSTESVNLRAQIDPGELPTTYLFEYTTEADFRLKGFTGATKFPQTGVGIGTGLVLKHLGELAPSTAYRFRVVATNSADVTVGPTRSFETGEPEAIFSLPDNRGWEMVSPVDKNGGEIQGFGGNLGGGVIQAAAQGGAITYTSASSFATPQGSPGPNQYLSTRIGSGWTTSNLTLPMLSGTYPEAPTSGVPYQLFSSDLSGALVSNGRRCRVSTLTECPVENAPLPGSGAPAGYRNYYLRSAANGSFKALLSSTDVSGLALDSAHFELAFVAATPNFSHAILSSCAALTVTATEVPGSGGECDPTQPNLYEWSGGGLTLVNLLPGDSTGTPGAFLAAQSRAVSTNGQRVYFTTGEGDPIYLREAGGSTKLLPETTGGGARFETASADGSLAFFVNAGHLYRYSAVAESSTDLTPSGEVLGVLGASDDGSFVYYRTPAGLFLSRNGSNLSISAQVDPKSTPASSGNARVTADGRRLLFLSTAELTDYDNRSLLGPPQPEVYLFAAPGTAGAGIVCVSCNPSGERPLGGASLPGASPNGSGPLAQNSYKPRVLSADSKRVYFESFDSLAVGDTNGDRDVYQWEAVGSGDCAKPRGCVKLISSGRAEGGASFLDASTDGVDVFFLTDGPLVPSDVGGVDVYDARAGGGFPTSSSAIPCFGDACQALPPEPANPTLGTLRSKPSGNLAPVVTRAHRCKKNQFKKQGKCVKRKSNGKKSTKKKAGQK
jgi:hypothetical protein